MRALVVTGTDTGVGKTVVTAALASLARARGQKVAVVKPVQTGVKEGEPGDLDEVRRLSGVEDLHELERFPDPLAPATAAFQAGVTPAPVMDLTERIAALADRDLVLVEGAGGLLVRFDETGATIADLASLLGAPTVLVTRAALGTLNHTALTCEGLRARNVRCLGLVIGAWPRSPDLAAECNLDDLPSYAGLRLLGRMPDGARRLSRAAFGRLAATELGHIPEWRVERAR
jgi:dethiobiotin synthetase